MSAYQHVGPIPCGRPGEGGHGMGGYGRVSSEKSGVGWLGSLAPRTR